MSFRAMDVSPCMAVSATMLVKLMYCRWTSGVFDIWNHYKEAENMPPVSCWFELSMRV